ncbi:unnamed protein product [Dicrocoelium dendriticum]|nr:unnamed protein product [Dicrocoelium dendriticum]
MPNCSTSRSYSPLRLASASPSRSRRHFSPSSDTNASESSENVTKRRRTMHEPPSSPTHSIEEHNRSYLSHSTELIDEDGNTVPFSLLETENPASQASSTGATIATIGGSTLDTLDAASDVTNCSVDTACNAHLDIARGYRSALMSVSVVSITLCCFFCILN